MNATDPLAQLRDIHLPEAISWWPPAPGWWLLGAALLALLAGLVLWLVRRHRAGAYRRQALAELAGAFQKWQLDGDASAHLQSVNAVLKRVALHSHQRATVARLSGSAWSEFLDAGSAGAGFSAIGFSDAHYGREAPACDIPRLHELSREWVKQHRGEPC